MNPRGQGRQQNLVTHAAARSVWVANWLVVRWTVLFGSVRAVHGCCRRETVHPLQFTIRTLWPAHKVRLLRGGGVQQLLRQFEAAGEHVWGRHCCHVSQVQNVIWRAGNVSLFTLLLFSSSTFMVWALNNSLVTCTPLFAIPQW